MSKEEKLKEKIYEKISLLENEIIDCKTTLRLLERGRYESAERMFKQIG